MMTKVLDSKMIFFRKIMVDMTGMGKEMLKIYRIEKIMDLFVFSDVEQDLIRYNDAVT